MTDGAAMWKIARDSGSLDLNSSYAYLLHCRDHARACRIATIDSEPAGFLLGMIVPLRPSTLFVWQIAVDTAFRGHGLAARMLDDVVADLVEAGEIDTVETTVTDDNAASLRLFHSFAERWGNTPISKSPLFEAEHFPDGHDAEPLYTIGPLHARDSPTSARPADS
ncbi:diaminobutyrate acetyltransferase [Microbacterium sp. LRZ72]|nr:diaminobutyrate acetyltransferase [Microbacterium sp. LRZ72]